MRKSPTLLPIVTVRATVCRIYTLNKHLASGNGNMADESTKSLLLLAVYHLAN